MNSHQPLRATMSALLLLPLGACPIDDGASPDAGSSGVDSSVRRDAGPAVDASSHPDRTTSSDSGAMPDAAESGDVGGPPDAAGNTDRGGGPLRFEAVVGARCALGNRIGLVQVSNEWGTRWAVATIHDRPNPLFGSYAISDDSCGLHEFPLETWCDPCDDGEVCGREGLCIPEQVLAEGARLILLGGGESQLIPNDGYGGTPSGEVTLAGTAFAAELVWGERTVTLAEMELPGELSDVAGELSGDSMTPTAMDINWTPTATGAQVYTLIPINHHAGGPTFTECFVDAATGALHIDGAMLQPLAVSTGLEFQGVDHTRFAAAETDVGCVELRFYTGQHVSY